MVTLVWASCKVCVQGKQEKRETDSSLGREAARAWPGTGNVDVGARRPCGRDILYRTLPFSSDRFSHPHLWPHSSHCPMASLSSLLKSCPYFLVYLLYTPPSISTRPALLAFL